jgi:hypothetical protein
MLHLPLSVPLAFALGDAQRNIKWSATVDLGKPVDLRLFLEASPLLRTV